jgi:processive 1,2-diacylglycerol beta-glucosyltransferase
MSKPGIAILYLSVGSGHQIAAEAIADSIKKCHPEIPIILEDPFTDKIDVLPSVLSALQTVSINLAPNLYDLAWRHKSSYDVYQWLEGINLLQEFLMDKFSKNSIDTVIATHVLPSILGVGLKKRRFIQKVYSIITDFGAHSYWPTQGVDSYFVATNELKNILSYRGVDNSIIEVTGIPIKEILLPRDFIKPTGKKIKLLFVAGGLRSGGYINSHHFFQDLLKGLAKISRDNLEITIVTGRQKHLKKELIKMQNDAVIKIRVLGYIEEMQKLIAAHDILIAKPGGLIIAEALAIGSCIILSQSGVGQENANSEFLARNNLAFRGESPDRIINMTKELINNPELIIEMKARTKAFGFPQSAKNITDKILGKK